MKTLIKTLFLAFFLFGILLGILATNSLQDNAVVSSQAELSGDELKRVKRFIQLNNPAKFKTGQVVNSQISQQDLNLLLAYLSQKVDKRLQRRISASVTLGDQQAYVLASVQLPKNPMGGYLNMGDYFNLALLFENRGNKKSTSAAQLELKSLMIGDMSIPAFVVGPLAIYLHEQLKDELTEYDLLSQAMANIEFENKKLRLKYVWDTQALDGIKKNISSRIISDEFKQALIAQSNMLTKLSYQLGSRPNLNEFFKPMFRLAKQRSLKNNPIDENKAIFAVLGGYSLDRNITNFFAEKDQKKIKMKKIVLNNRYDLSKHLLVSAAITSLADSNMAEAIGLGKEVDDSLAGSGFSFADLAADRAGIRLAEYSLLNQQQARQIQEKMLMLKTEAEYMPRINNLPEGIRKPEFNKRYANSALYTKLENTIKLRIDRLAIYR